MQDISDMGRTATQFVPMWQNEMAKLNGPAKEPCTFEEFARVQIAYGRCMVTDIGLISVRSNSVQFPPAIEFATCPL